MSLKYEMTRDGIIISTLAGVVVGHISHEIANPGIDPMTIRPWVVYFNFDMAQTDGGETGPRVLFNSLEAAKYSVLSEWLEHCATIDRIESMRIADKEIEAGRA